MKSMERTKGQALTKPPEAFLPGTESFFRNPCKYLEKGDEVFISFYMNQLSTGFFS